MKTLFALSLLVLSVSTTHATQADSFDVCVLRYTQSTSKVEYSCNNHSFGNEYDLNISGALRHFLSRGYKLESTHGIGGELLYTFIKN